MNPIQQWYPAFDQQPNVAQPRHHLGAPTTSVAHLSSSEHRVLEATSASNYIYNCRSANAVGSRICGYRFLQEESPLLGTSLRGVHDTPRRLEVSINDRPSRINHSSISKKHQEALVGLLSCLIFWIFVSIILGCFTRTPEKRSIRLEDSPSLIVDGRPEGP